jgi:hypothetical protein
MIYIVDYRYVPKGGRYPEDGDAIVGLEAQNNTGLTLLPQVGDYVQVGASTVGVSGVSIRGRVQSRTFTYEPLIADISCTITIIIAEVDAEELEFNNT